tara:strand:+ start:378 stop:572 length:195 start_codon:yes stop_codon:yes gene_type:complete
MQMIQPFHRGVGAGVNAALACRMPLSSDPNCAGRTTTSGVQSEWLRNKRPARRVAVSKSLIPVG